MVEGYKGQIFREQFEAGSQEGNNSGRDGGPPDHSNASVERPPQADTPEKPSYKNEAQPSAEDAFPAGFRNPPPEGSFVFVNPLPSSRSLAGRKIIQRLRGARHAGNDHSPGPNNPSDAK